MNLNEWLESQQWGNKNSQEHFNLDGLPSHPCKQFVLHTVLDNMRQKHQEQKMVSVLLDILRIRNNYILMCFWKEIKKKNKPWEINLRMNRLRPYGVLQRSHAWTKQRNKSLGFLMAFHTKFVKIWWSNEIKVRTKPWVAHVSFHWHC